MAAKSTTTEQTREPISAWEQCLRRQLPIVLKANQLAALKLELRALLTSEERCLRIYEWTAPMIQAPAGPEENKFFDEMFDMIRSCRGREWGTDSHKNLIGYLAQRAIPMLAAYRDDEL